MKKIVALVLCLALALSLCSVAVAETLFEGNELRHMVGDKGSYGVKLAKNGAEKAKEFDTYAFTKDGAELKGAYYVISDASSADYTLVDGSKVENYYLYIGIDADKNEEWKTKASELKVYNWIAYGEMDEELQCGKLFGASKEYTFYLGENDKVYRDNGNKYGEEDPNAVLLNVNGKAVAAVEVDVIHFDENVVNGNEDWEDAVRDFLTAIEKDALDTGKAILLIDHYVEFDYDYTDEGDLVIEDVECDRCDKVLDYVTSSTAAVNKWGVNNYHEVINGDESIWVACTLDLKGNKVPTGGSASGTTVESAKTFDAGIALYAGMALASVAGSAVVIGKKKEF